MISLDVFFFSSSPLGNSNSSLYSFHASQQAWRVGILTHSLLLSWDTNKHPFVKIPLTYTHCPHRSSDSALGNVLQSHRKGPGTSQLHLRSCIIPAMATEPTPNTQPTSFSPNSPNCQSWMGIWEALANKLEHSWHLVQDLHNHSNRLHIPFPPRACRHVYPFLSRGDEPFLWEGVQADSMHFIPNLSSWCACITDITL